MKLRNKNLIDFFGVLLAYSIFIPLNGTCMEQIESPSAYTKLTWTCQCGTVYAYGESCTNPDCPSNQ